MNEGELTSTFVDGARDLLGAQLPWPNRSRARAVIRPRRDRVEG
jgi:hypothetical protein